MRSGTFHTVLLLGCTLLFGSLKSQTPYVYTIKTDSIRITNCDSAELILENHTQGIPGFLYNTGRGRTIFKRGLQSLGGGMYLIGADTLKLAANAWLQGGNAFGTTGVLGTTDNNSLDLYTNNTDRARLYTNGDLLLGATVDSNYKLDVKGIARYGAYNGSNRIRGNLDFDNGSFTSYIMEQGSTQRSIQIPGTGGASPWIINNTNNFGVNIVDAAGTITLAGGKFNITSTNFNTTASIISTEPSSANNRTIYIGNATTLNHANENGTNISLIAGNGGSIPSTASFSGGWIAVNGGLKGTNGTYGNLLLNNQNDGYVGIQTSTPVSNFEVDQGTTANGVVTNAAGGTSVAGVSTNFTNTFQVGDSITIGGQTVVITAIASDISMTTGVITNANDSVTYTLAGGRRFHVKGNGRVGVGTSAPTSQVDIAAPNGYSQLRLRSSYTPTSSADTNGNVGDFTWDSNYLYIKTSSGWKRTALSSF